MKTGLRVEGHMMGGGGSKPRLWMEIHVSQSASLDRLSLNILLGLPHVE